MLLSRRVAYAHTASALATLVLSLALSVPAAAAAQDRSRSTLSVVGEGQARVQHDLAIITTGVVSQAGQAKDALAENSKAMGEVIAAAKQAGIDAKDLETTRVSVQLQYSYPPSGSREPRKIVGYEASNTLSIRVRELDQLGPLLDRLVGVGANQIRNVELAVAEPGPTRDLARATAMKDAVRKAGIYAEAAGVKIVRVISIAEGQQNGPRPPMPRTLAMGAAETRAMVPIEAGEQEFRSRITAIFEIEPR